MRKMEIKKRHGFKRAMVLFANVSVLIISLFACDDQEDRSSKSGKLRLNLAADTTSLKRGVNSSLTKSVTDEFEEFLKVEDYRICITTATDTVKSFDRFDEMPAEIELPEGAYTLIASKGENPAAGFENPYFEGSTDFTIIEEMSTPLEVTCTLGNARITADYTDDFKEAYTDYTVLLSSAYATTDLEIAKGETRPAYMKVDKEGTDVAIGIRLKKLNAEEEKTYYVPTAIKMERRQNVRLIFKTDGEALEGIGLDILLDDSLTTKTFTTKIPDFMWQQFDKPTLSAVEFKGDGSDDVFKTTAGSFDRNLQVGVVMPGGIGSLTISYWKEGEMEEDAVSYNLTTDNGVAAAKAKHFTWTFGEKETDINLLEKKTAQLYLKDGINSLESLEDVSCIYNFKISGYDATGKHHISNDIQFKVEVLPAEAPIVSSNQAESLYTITEGDELAADWQLNFAATGLIDPDATKVIVNDESGDQEYYFLKDDGAALLKSSFGATVEIENAAHAIVSFPKAFAASLLAPEEGSKEYTFTFYLKDKKNKEYSISKKIVVNAPEFVLDVKPEEAFARHAILRVNLHKGDKRKLKFQYKLQSGGDWIDIVNTSKDNESLYVETLKELQPNTSYLIRVWYNNKRKSQEEVAITTEKEIFLGKDGEFSDWYSEKIYSEDSYVLGMGAGIDIYQYWPSVDKSSGIWATRNNLTNSQRSGTTCYYTSYSGTIPTDDGYVGKAAEISTLGWGAGNTYLNTMTGVVIKNKDAGMLYIGSHSYNSGKESFNYGYPFTARPSKMSFMYKFKSINSESFKAYIVVENRDESGNVIELGRGEMVSNKDFASYTSASVNIQYDRTDLLATHMYIVFVSSTADSPSVDLATGSYNTLKGFSDSRYVGNVLTIDNVELIYE